MNVSRFSVSVGLALFMSQSAFAASTGSGAQTGNLNSNGQVNAVAAKPIEQMSKQVISLPVDSKSGRKTTSAQGTGLPPIQSQPDPKQTDKPSAKSSAVQGGDSPRQGLARGTSSNSPASPLTSSAPGILVSPPTTINGDLAVDELEKRVRTALEGKLGTDGEVTLKLAPQEVPLTQDGSIDKGAKRLRDGRSTEPTAVIGSRERATLMGIERSITGSQVDRVSQKWAWSGGSGPSQWGRIDPEFILCSSGRSQSPIEIRPNDAFLSTIAAPSFFFNPSSISIGKSQGLFTIETLKGGFLLFRGERWELDRIHIFSNALHVVRDGGYNGAFVFWYKLGLRILAVDVPFIHRQDFYRNHALQMVLQRAPLDVNDQPKFSDLEWNPGELMASHSGPIYFYNGSHLVPPCNEGVSWLVFETPVRISTDQANELKRFVPEGYRPIQANNGRPVFSLVTSRH